MTIDGGYTLTEVFPGRWLAVAHWRLPGEAMLFDGAEYPWFSCFAGSRRRCKAWAAKLGRELRKAAEAKA